MSTFKLRDDGPDNENPEKENQVQETAAEENAAEENDSAFDQFYYSKNPLPTQNEDKPVEENGAYGDDWMNNNDEPFVNKNERMSMKEYYDLPMWGKRKPYVTTACVLLYFSAIVSFVVLSMFGDIVGGITDLLIIGGLTAGVQFKKSRVCAVLLAVIYGASLISKFSQGHRIGSIWPLCAAGYLVSFTFEFKKFWKNYQLTGQA